MHEDKPGGEARPGSADKTASHKKADAYSNGVAGQFESGNVASGERANNVIQQAQRHDANPDASSQPDDADVARDTGQGGEQGSKGSGRPIVSGAGRLADDRPGRNDAKK